MDQLVNLGLALVVVREIKFGLQDDEIAIAEALDHPLDSPGLISSSRRKHADDAAEFLILTKLQVAGRRWQQNL